MEKYPQPKMNYLLIILLILLLILFYYANGRRLFSASIIAISSFLAAGFFIVLNPEIFSEDIDILTIIYIVSSLFMFGVGETIVITRNPIGYDYAQEIDSNQPIRTSNLFLIIISSIQLSIGIYNYYLLYRASLAFGNPGSIFGAVAYTRSATIHGLVSIGNSYINLAYNTLLAVSTYYYIAFFYNLFFCKITNILMLLPYLCSIVNSFSSTGRTVFIKYVCVALMIYVTLYQCYKRGHVRIDKKMIKVGIIALAAIFVLFALVGRMRTRESGVYSASSNIAEYIGVGIYGLDSTIGDRAGFSSKLLGQESFKWFYEILQDDFNIALGVSHFDPWFDNKGIVSNVYTAICSYYKDFGFVLGSMGQLVVGAVYGVAYRKISRINNWKRNAWKLVFYSYSMYPIFMYSIGNYYYSVFYAFGFFIYFVVYIVGKHYIRLSSRRKLC